jgi:hypothetical protein
MNDIYKCSPRAFVVASLQICLALTVASCDSDSTIEEEECTEIGETESCDDEAGNPGFKVCLPEGVYTECLYLIPIAGQPCSDLGEEYACVCDGRLTGNMYCLKDRTYSECFCDSAPTSPLGSAGSGGQDTASGSGDACPPSFSCMELPQGGTVNKLCVKDGMPPLCENNADCDAEGLEEAQCVDIGVGTKICLQVCN